VWKLAAADVAARTSKGNRAGLVFDPFTTDHYAVVTMLTRYPDN
jgi:hypothetical protein